MKSAVRKILVISVLLALTLCAATAFAQDQRVFDDANLFSAEQKSALEESVTALREAKDIDVAIVTTSDAQGKTAMAYADDYYDEHGFGTGGDLSGVLFLIDMDNREAYISTGGTMINILTDARIQAILDDAYTGLSNEDYASAANAFINGITRYIDEGVPAGQYQYDTETGSTTRYRALTMTEILIFLAIAVFVGLIIRWTVVGNYRMKTSSYQYPYTEKSAVNLTQCDDLFINQTLTSHRIQTDTGGSGGGAGRSSVHHSSGGGSHGGGGRRF